MRRYIIVGVDWRACIGEKGGGSSKDAHIVNELMHNDMPHIMCRPNLAGEAMQHNHTRCHAPTDHPDTEDTTKVKQAVAPLNTQARRILQFMRKHSESLIAGASYRLLLYCFFYTETSNTHHGILLLFLGCPETPA